VYVAFASPHIVDGDNAEFATLGALGGRAHPSGYPLYVLWLRLWSWLPGSTPAHTAAIATAILGALAIGVWHAACVAWGARPLAALISIAIVGAAPLVQRYHCEAEVFAMNNLVVGLVVWLAAERGPLRGRGRGAALGLVAGAGLANNLTCVLIAPIGLLGIIRAGRESRVSTYAIALGGLVLGLAPCAYLGIADGPASWGVVSTPSELMAFMLRREYGGATRFLLDGTEVAWTASVVACLATIARSWLWLPAIAGGAMFALRIWHPSGESRWAWALLLASFVLAGPLLATRFNIDPHGLGLYVCERFHVLPVLLVAVPVAAAADLACAHISRTTLATSLTIAGFVALSIARWPQLSRAQSPAMELGIKNLLGSLPRGSIVVVAADDQCFGGRYLQLTRGQRADVAVVCAGLLPARWYRAAWARQGLEIPPTTGPSLGDALLRTNRPVFVDPSTIRVLAEFPSYPFGVVMRVLPRGVSAPPASEVAEMNRDLFRAFDLDYPRPSRDDSYAAVAHHRYAACWAAIARRLDAQGDRRAALDAFELTRVLQPTAD